MDVKTYLSLSWAVEKDNSWNCEKRKEIRCEKYRQCEENIRKMQKLKLFKIVWWYGTHDMISWWRIHGIIVDITISWDHERNGQILWVLEVFQISGEGVIFDHVKWIIFEFTDGGVNGEVSFTWHMNFGWKVKN